MPLKIPPELKKITQYVRRSEELAAQNSPQTLIVSYHCLQYAVQTGIPLATTPVGKSCLGNILSQLEQNRPKMGNFSREEKYKICRDFALQIFDKADAEDRAGNSGKSTAKTFYAAASFLGILKQFQSEEDQESEDAVEEQKKSFYAKWKATDILKAIKEGREVKSGGYGEDLEDKDDEIEVAAVEPEAPLPPSLEGTEVGMDGRTQPSFREPSSPPPPAYNDVESVADNPPPMAPHVPKPPLNNFAPPIKPMPVPAPAPAPSSGGGFMSNFFGGGASSSNSRYSKEVLADAKELTKFALKALESKDGDLAAQRLREALAALGHEM